MAFCTNCGSKLDDNSAFCTVCGTAVKNDVVNQSQQSQVVYEEFVPTLGMGRKFAFKEKSLVYSDKEYEYAKLKPITLITAPTFASNGVAQTTSEDGELLTLAFDIINYKIITVNFNFRTRWRLQNKFVFFSISVFCIDLFISIT